MQVMSGLTLHLCACVASGYIFHLMAVQGEIQLSTMISINMLGIFYCQGRFIAVCLHPPVRSLNEIAKCDACAKVQR